VELREVPAAFRAAWWLPLVGVIVGSGVAALISSLQTPLYTTSTQLFVSTSDSTSTADVFQGGQFSQQRVTSYARLITGEELASRVIDRLGLDISPSELSEQITASAVTNTVLIEVTVTDASPVRAQSIAAVVGEEFTQFASALEAPDEGGQSPVKVTVTDRPEVPSVPSSPQASRNVAIGLVLGLLGGAGVVIIRARLDRTVKDPNVASEVTGAPIIGTVFQDRMLERQHVIVRTRDNRTAEGYRQLRTNLQFLNVDKPPKVIMVSSAVPSEGKTTVVINLALALADAGRRVTIIEADLRRPKVTRYLGLVGGVGLTNILAGTAAIDEVLQSYGSDEFSVIAAGPIPPNPGELLSSSHMSALVEELRGKNDYVLVDAPPLLPVADSSGLAVMMDGVLLSVRYGSTTTLQLRQAATTLERVGAKTLGVILNIVPAKAELASAYGYGYSYSSGDFGSGQ
jgi:capsular exopolysaccharide synthesis family protein